MAQRFDVEKLKLLGEPTTVSEGIRVSIRRGAIQASLSGTGLLAHDSTVGTKLVWMSHDGRRLEDAGSNENEDTNSFALSLDGQRALLTRPEAGGGLSLWLSELNRRVVSRLTPPGRGGFSIWSPDGRWAIYGDGSPLNLFLKPTSNAGEVRRLTQSARFQYPGDWSRNGRLIAYDEAAPGTGLDIWILPMTPDGTADPTAKPWPYLRTKFMESGAHFSPEPSPHWMIYQSDETGRIEVYLQSFPDPRFKWQVSTQGGRLPRWGSKGNELYYVSPEDHLMSVSVKFQGPAAELSTPRQLFTLPARLQDVGRTRISMYEPDPRSDRFLVLTSADQGQHPLTVISNWPALIKKGAR